MEEITGYIPIDWDKGKCDEIKRRRLEHGPLQKPSNKQKNTNTGNQNQPKEKKVGNKGISLEELAAELQNKPRNKISIDPTGIVVAHGNKKTKRIFNPAHHIPSYQEGHSAKPNNKEEKSINNKLHKDQLPRDNVLNLDLS